MLGRMSHDQDPYEGLADSYDQTFRWVPSREHVEAYTLRRLLGDLTDLSVLDLACGTGLFTRTIRRWGAARVLGVDLSEDMVRVARSHEEDDPLGVEYTMGDVVALPELGKFDCAVAIYLLSYATSRETIVQMGRSVLRNLKPGGRFLTYLLGPEVSRTPGYYLKYGFDYDFSETRQDGDLMRFSLALGDTVMQLSAHYWDFETVASAFEEAGFAAVRKVRPELSEQGRARYGSEYWEEFLRYPPAIFLEGTAPRR
jgi:ubiquinone/menaquinone biosynthesis C-methylase UbiE